MRDLIKKEIEKVVGRANFDVFKSENFGDYSSNVAMALRIDAENLKSQILNLKSDIFEKVEVAGPGFLNFYLKDEVFIENIGKILKSKEKYGLNENLKNKKIMVEYTDPNPFKEFHIGHLMSNAIGESIARLYESQGAKVKRACYQGDVGLHVAKAILAVKDFEKKAFLSKDTPLKDKVMFWGSAYAAGSDSYESSEKWKEETIEINKKIYDKSDPWVNALYKEGKRVSLEYFETIYKKLGTRFDYYFFESETGKLGKEIIEKNIPEIFEKSEGAIIFPKEKSGLHTRVFINSEGLPTYEAKELGLAKIKYDKYKYDISIVITGNEINDYFKVLLKAMEFVYPELVKKTEHIGHGMLRLPTGKMSSRTGDIITGESLIEKLKEMVFKKIKERDFSESEKEKIAEIVAVGAIKYSILKQAIGGDIIFDFDKSVSFEGDSGPYLQYTYVRAQSVLKNAEEKGIKASVDIKDIKITNIEKLLLGFPEIVEDAMEKYAPNYICSYLIELAHAFNSYYSKFQIVREELESSYRVALTKAVAITIKNGLNLLGISAPEKM